MILIPQLAIFCGALLFFHASELLLAHLYMDQTSLLLSKPYCAAMLCALAEFILEGSFAPYIKLKVLWVSHVGTGAILAGECMRKAAMVLLSQFCFAYLQEQAEKLLQQITARGSFTHALRFGHHPTGVLVTHGIYSYMRHPGYAGWLLWAVGTQLLLLNPICTLCFAALSWAFFRKRIKIEEQQLRLFFPGRYEEYAERTPSGIPFVR